MSPRLYLALCGGLAAANVSPSSVAFTLLPIDEPATQLVSPLSAAPSMPLLQYSGDGQPVLNLVTATPLLCANTSPPTLSPAIAVNATYYSDIGIANLPALPFVFGAAGNSPETSASAQGISQIGYDGELIRFSGDPLDSLVCYGLDPNGAHKVTRNLFNGDFEQANFNSSLTVSVFHLPAAANDWYGYAVDVTIPPLPAGTNCGPDGLDCNFALIEGYDTSVFATGNGQWCLAPAGTQECLLPPPAGGTAPAFGDIRIDYSNYGTSAALSAPVAPEPAKQYHFVAFRYLRAGVNSLPSGVPLVIASLFSPLDLDENKLDDNVGIGNNILAN